MDAKDNNRSKAFLQIGFILALGIGLIVFVNFLLSVKPSTANRNVHFRVESSGGFSVITLQAGKTIISKPATVTTPWNKTVQVAKGEQVYLTASNPNMTGKITCLIEVNKQTIQSESTLAPKNGVACGGIVP